MDVLTNNGFEIYAAFTFLFGLEFFFGGGGDEILETFPPLYAAGTLSLMVVPLVYGGLIGEAVIGGDFGDMIGASVTAFGLWYLAEGKIERIEREVIKRPPPEE